MNNDAQEAAMGLLSLSPSNFPPPHSLIPLKRKHPPSSSGNVKRRPSNKAIQPQQQNQPSAEGDVSSETINCICGSSYDDGFSIACDDCSRWCHAACFDIVQGGEVPEEWRCWECFPRPVDREKAARMQKNRQTMRMREEQLQQQRQQQSLTDSHQHRRRVSPGLERKHRRTSMAAIDGSSTNNSRRKRRASFVLPQPEEEPDVVVDIDEPWSHSYVPITRDIVPSTAIRERLRKHAQSWRGITALSSLPPPPAQPRVAIHPLPSPSSDIRPPSYAVHTTAPITSESFITPFTSTITPSAAYLADPLNAYAHLGLPKPFVHLIGPPLDLALDARIAGDEARFVRSGCRPNAVLRPVLCRQPRATDSRDGYKDPSVDKGREGAEERTLAFGVFALRDLKAHEEVVLGWEWDDGHAIHKLPALIRTPELFPPAHQTHLRAQMSNILHLLSSTFTTCACGSHARDCALRQMERFVDGLPFDDPPVSHSHRQPYSNSTSHPQPRPASGIDSPHTPPIEGELSEREREYQRPGAYTGNSGSAVAPGQADLGPLVGASRGFRTRERLVGSGGMGGVEMWVDDGNRGEGSSRHLVNGDIHRGASGHVGATERKAEVEKEVEVDAEETEDELEVEVWPVDEPKRRTRFHARVDRGLPVSSPPMSNDDQQQGQQPSRKQDQRQTLHQLRPPDPLPPPLHQQHTPDEPNLGSEPEEKMPPKMRKRWMHREVEALKVTAKASDLGGDNENEVGLGFGDGRGTESRDRNVEMEVDLTGEGAKENVAEEEKKVEENGMEIDEDGRHHIEPQIEVFHTPDSPAIPTKPSSPPSEEQALTKMLTALPAPEPLQSSTPAPGSKSPSFHDSLNHLSILALPPPLGTDSPSTSFARLSLFSPAVSHLGFIGAGNSSQSPKVLHEDLGLNAINSSMTKSANEAVVGDVTLAPREPLIDDNSEQDSEGALDAVEKSNEQPHDDPPPVEHVSDRPLQEGGILENKGSPLQPGHVTSDDVTSANSSTSALPPAEDAVMSAIDSSLAGLEGQARSSPHPEVEASLSLPLELPPAPEPASAPPRDRSPSPPPIQEVSIDPIEHARTPSPPPIRVRTPTPQPQPPQKVKMSLKDYKLRKQKRREEEEKEKAAAAASGLGICHESNMGGLEGISTNPSVAGSTGGSTEPSPIVETVGLAPETEVITKESQGSEMDVQMENDGVGHDPTAPNLQNDGSPWAISMVRDDSTATAPPTTSTEAVQDESLRIYDARQTATDNATPQHTQPPPQFGKYTQPNPLPSLPLRPLQSIQATTAQLPSWPSPTKPPPDPYRHPQAIVYPTTFRAKAELIDLPLPPLVSHKAEHNAKSMPSIFKMNGDSANYPRPLSERIGPHALRNQSPSASHQHQSSQEDGEISLGEDTPSPQPLPSRSIPPTTTPAPRLIPPYVPSSISPPRGPRALLSNPGVVQHQRRVPGLPYQNSNSSQLSPVPGAPPAANVQVSRQPPTGPRSLRLGGFGQHQHSRTLPPRGPANQNEGSSGPVVPDWNDRYRGRPGGPPLRRQSTDREGSATPSAPDDAYDRRALGPLRGPFTERERSDRDRERTFGVRSGSDNYPRSGWGR